MVEDGPRKLRGAGSVCNGLPQTKYKQDQKTNTWKYTVVYISIKLFGKVVTLQTSKQPTATFLLFPSSDFPTLRSGDLKNTGRSELQVEVDPATVSVRPEGGRAKYQNNPQKAYLSKAKEIRNHQKFALNQVNS